MKKNIAMRVAAILFILTMISTCAFSTTFAKYVTSDEATDTARVAKWGVVVTATDNSMFGTTYASDSSFTGNTVAHSADKLVAPGTKGSQTVITITGTPEVAVNVKYEVTVTSEIKLAAGIYDDLTTGDTTDKFTLADEYYPVVFTLTKTVDSTDTVLVTEGKLTDVEDKLEAESKDYAPNENLNVTYSISWKWVFDGNDQADTYLGSEASLQEIDFKIVATVTQID